MLKLNEILILIQSKLNIVGQIKIEITRKLISSNKQRNINTKIQEQITTNRKIVQNKNNFQNLKIIKLDILNILNISQKIIQLKFIYTKDSHSFSILRLSKMNNTIQFQIKQEDQIISSMNFNQDNNLGDTIKKSKKKLINNNYNININQFNKHQSHQINIIQKESSLHQIQQQNTNIEKIQLKKIEQEENDKSIKIKQSSESQNNHQKSNCQQISMQDSNQQQQQSSLSQNLNILQNVQDQNLHQQTSQRQDTQEMVSLQVELINTNKIQTIDSINFEQKQTKDQQEKNIDINEIQDYNFNNQQFSVKECNQVIEQQQYQSLNFDNQQNFVDLNAFDQSSNRKYQEEKEIGCETLYDLTNTNERQTIDSQNIEQKQLKEEQVSEVDIELINSIMSVFQGQKGKFLKQKEKKVIEDICKDLARQKYSVQEYLVSGTEGDIFIGKQEAEDKEIIFKIYTDQEKEYFEEELKMINSIKNPINIVKVLNHIMFEEHKIYILISEKCQFSLFDELKLLKKKNEFTINQLCYIIFDLLDGLIELRSHNIIHQDIKPQNILKTNSGDYIYSDFGCSSWKHNQFLKNGHTPFYSAPEQKNKDMKIDYQSDLYCLGKTFGEVIKIFNEINQSNNDKKTDLQNKFLDIVKQNMVMTEIKEREEVLKLLLTFYQQINYFIYGDINKWYNKKYQILLIQILSIMIKIITTFHMLIFNIISSIFTQN